MRDTKRDWIKDFARNCGNLYSVLTEMWAFRDGLLLAKELKIISLIVELYALVDEQLHCQIFIGASTHRNFLKTSLTCRLCTHPGKPTCADD